jgi:two-component system OmpR family response regulator
MDKILIVDDEPSVRDALSDILSFLGYEVVAKGTGRDALRTFLDDSISLVLTDMDMPEMDGLTLAVHIKDKSPNTPVVLMTGFHREAVTEKLEGRFVDSIILKPFRLEEIENTLRTTLKKSVNEKGMPESSTDWRSSSR